MGHPLEELLFGVPERSVDGRLHTAFPKGDAPNTSGSAQGLGASVAVTALAASGAGSGSGAGAGASTTVSASAGSATGGTSVEPEISTYGSLRFYGTGSGGIDRVEADSLDCNIGDTDFTIDFWFKCASGNNASAITAGSGYLWITGNTIIDRDRYDQGRAFGVSLTAGRITFGLKNASGVAETWRCTTDCRDDEWHHCRIERALSSGAVAIWIDGTREVYDTSGPTGDISYPADAVPNSNGVANDHKTVFGAEKHDVNAVTYPSFRGWLSEVLFQAELMSSMTSTSITVPASRHTATEKTVALWHFQEESGTTCEDAAGNADAQMKVGGTNLGPKRSTDSPWASVADLLDDDFEDRSTGTVSMTTPWTSKGYVDGNFSGLTIQPRSTYSSSTMLADIRMPVPKSRFLQANYGGNEGAGRAEWNFSSSLNLRDLYVSFWEYRPSGSRRAGEKWVRFGSKAGSDTRIHDIIFFLGSGGVDDFGVLFQGQIQGSPNLSDVYFSTFSWDGSLAHFEFRVRLGTNDNNDGILQAWMNGSLIANATNVRTCSTNRSQYFNQPLTLAEVGGWSSATQYYPITRVIPRWRVATTRQGVWSLT